MVFHFIDDDYKNQKTFKIDLAGGEIVTKGLNKNIRKEKKKLKWIKKALVLNGVKERVIEVNEE